MTKEQTIQRLQFYVTNLSAQSMQHRIECIGIQNWLAKQL